MALVPNRESRENRRHTTPQTSLAIRPIMCRMSTAAQREAESVIPAAGGLLLRRDSSGEEQVCIVFRKQRQDWTLPKGKLEPNESFQAAAHREVREETGWNTEVGEYLGAIGYNAGKHPKVVLFWRMAPVNEEKIANPDEIVKAEWVSIPIAIERLTYPAEKDFLGRFTRSTDLPHIVRPGYSWLDQVFHLKRARARLARECEVFAVELGFLEERSHGADKSWAQAARRHLFAARRYEQAGEIEGGWVCLHAARRQALFALDRKELQNRAEILRREAKKISSWRAEAINACLGKDEQVTPEGVGLGMMIRDEYYANQYHRVWLTGDQLRILIGICGPALLLLVVLTRFHLQEFSKYSSTD